MSDDAVKQLDDFLIRAYPRLATERELETAAWLADQRRRSPEPSFFSFAARRDWRAAFAEAARLPVERSMIDAVVLPLWGCDHAEDATNDVWQPETLLVSADGRAESFGGHVAPDQMFAVRIERVRRGRVAPSRSYAPDVPHRLYNAHHIVLASEGTERILAVHGSVQAPTTPRPTRELPPWTSGAVAAVDLAGLGALAASFPPSRGEDYRTSEAGPPWRTLVEAAIAAQCAGPPDDEEDPDPRL